MLEYMNILYGLKKINFWINIIYESIMLIKFLDFGCFENDFE